MAFDLTTLLRQTDPNEDWLARHVVTQAQRGRRLADVLSDPIVTRRCDAITRARVLDRSEVVEALSEIATARLRDEIAQGPRVLRDNGPAVRR
jgi:hypothetical protein